MPTKLTLRLDETLIQAAKNYAHSQGRSVSVLVADYFAQLTQQNPALDAAHPAAPPTSKITAKLRGALANPNGPIADAQDYKRHLETKYQ
jgi:Family of unknown function (DUF6364)